MSPWGDNLWTSSYTKLYTIYSVSHFEFGFGFLAAEGTLIHTEFHKAKTEAWLKHYHQAALLRDVHAKWWRKQYAGPSPMLSGKGASPDTRQAYCGRRTSTAPPCSMSKETWER